MKPSLTEERVLAEMKLARESFAKHEIASIDGGSWLVREPGTSTFWYEVVVLRGGKLLVHGDIQAVIFGTFHADEKSSKEENRRACVRWMASRKRPDDRYFVEKAHIGGTAETTIWTDDEDVLL